MAPSGNTVAVIGAGIVGLSCALWLQRSGFAVTLVERHGPGEGASFGNAGALAPHAFVPVNSPSIPRRLPRLLMAGGSPLSMDWTYAPKMMPWLFRFLVNCTEARVRHIAEAMHRLMARNIEFALPLFKASGADQLMRAQGYLHLYESEEAYRDAHLERALYRQFAGDMVELDAAEIRQMEPNLAPVFVRALFFESAMHYASPVAVCRALAAHFAVQGGTIVKAEIGRVEKAADDKLALRHEGGAVLADQVVLAAGAHSRTLFGGLIESLPLETERGYHVVFAGAGDLIRRSVSSATAGFAMTPMTDGLRCAGMVELAGLDKAPNPACHAYLTRTARRFLPDLPAEPTTRWMGFRPSMPDAMPVIGRSRRTPAVIFAFGHQHVGMSSGCVTGRMVAAIARGEPPPVDPAPFAPGRFGGPP